MATLKQTDAKKMSKEDREAKLKELKIELVRSNVTAQKSNAKHRQIKKSIARLYTLSNSIKSNSEALKK